MLCNTKFVCSLVHVSGCCSPAALSTHASGEHCVFALHRCGCDACTDQCRSPDRLLAGAAALLLGMPNTMPQPVLNPPIFRTPLVSFPLRAVATAARPTPHPPPIPPPSSPLPPPLWSSPPPSPPLRLPPPRLPPECERPSPLLHPCCPRPP